MVDTSRKYGCYPIKIPDWCDDRTPRIGATCQARAFLSTKISARSNIDAASEADYLVIALLNIGIAMPRVARE